MRQYDPPSEDKYEAQVMNKTIKNTYTTHILITDNEHYNNRCQYWMSVTESTTYDLRIQENNGK